MTSMTVYDPPMCCRTGVCGTDVDPKVAQFAADLEWLKTKGVEVQRFNLAQEPEKFIENSAIKAVLEKSDGDDLPAILVGDELVSTACFPNRDALRAMAGLDSAVTGSGDQPASSATESNGCGCGPNSADCS